MLTDEELELGGFRFEDLQEKRIVENRTDLLRKQRELGFPRPVKTGASQAFFLKSEVYAWLRQRVALRDEKIQNAKSPGRGSQDVKSSAPSPEKIAEAKPDKRRAVTEASRTFVTGSGKSAGKSPGRRSRTRSESAAGAESQTRGRTHNHELKESGCDEQASQKQV